MELFKFDPGLVIWTWIVFGVLFVILQKYAFPPLLKSIKMREETLAQAVEQASQIQKRLSAIEREQAEMMKQSKAQASELLRQTRLQAEMVRKDLLKQAREDAHGVLSDAKVKIEEEKKAALYSLRTQIADFVCDTSEKVIGKSFVSSEDHAWVEELAKTL